MRHPPGRRRLAAGQSQSWPFAVEVPPDAAPSLATQRTTVEWVLVGVVARRMRRDFTGELALAVHTA